MRPIRTSVLWFLLVATAAAPAAMGCQAPWAWGFLYAALYGTATALLILEWTLPPDRRLTGVLFSPPLQGLGWAGLASLLWIGASYAYDVSAGTAGGRLPALSFRSLLAAGAYAAAFLCGLTWGSNGSQLRRGVRLIFVAGAFYACIVLAQKAGLGPRQVLGWPILEERPSGVYTNPNRYAVLLSLGWACGLGLLGAQLMASRTRRSRRGRVLRKGALFLLAAGVVLTSAGIAATLSRLTLLSAGAGLGLVFAVVLWKRSVLEKQTACGRYREEGRKVLRGRLVWLLAVLLPSMGFLVWGLAVSGHGLASRLERLVAGPDMASRARAWRVCAELTLERPGLGWGLESFDTVFATRQPLEFSERWQSAHSDWLQMGMELGLPGLLALAVAVGAWLWIWGQGLRLRRRDPGFYLALGAGLGVLVVLACSAADFPLREPATAALFFMLAGALARYGHERALRSRSRKATSSSPASRGAGGTFLRLPISVFAVILVPLFLLGAYCSGRIGWASASSPWLGWVMPPPAHPEQVPAYRRALECAPKDPQLLFPYARALLEKLRTAPREERQALRTELETATAWMREVNPRDYRAPWMEAVICLQAGEAGKAAEGFRRAVDMAPSYRELRRQALFCVLEYGAANRALPWDERLPYFVQALEHMRVFLAYNPEWEGVFAADLKRVGASASEVVRLWPEPRPEAALSRARFWIGEGLFDRAAEELAGPALGLEESAWYAALSGRVQWERGDAEKALVAWAQTFKSLTRSPDPWLESWLSESLGKIPLAAVGELAEKVPEVAELPVPLLAAARRLIRENRWTLAERLLQRHAQVRPTPEGLRCWAELALHMRDRESALAHAREAFERSDGSPAWQAWWEAFYGQAAAVAPR